MGPRAKNKQNYNVALLFPVDLLFVSVCYVKCFGIGSNRWIFVSFRMHAIIVGRAAAARETVMCSSVDPLK